MASNRLGYIDGFRGIFALAIALMHHNRSIMFPGAYLAVDFFFVLSGFILCYVYLPRMTHTSAFDFIGARLARLWPLHIFTMLLYVVIYIPSNYYASGTFKWMPNWKGNNFSSFFENVLMIHNVGLQETITWNYPAWSISVEFWVNIALFFVLGALVVKKSHAGLLAILAFVILACYTVLEISLPHLGGRPGIDSQYAYILNAGLLRGFAGIFLGVLVFKATQGLDCKMDREFSPSVRVLKTIFEFSLMAVIFYLMWFQPKSETDITAIFIFAILLLSLTVGKTSWLRQILGLKPFTFLGMISYGIYLCHAPLLQFFKRWSKLVGEGWNEWGVAAIFTTTVIIVATVLFYLVETPGKRLFKRVWTAIPHSRT